MKLADIKETLVTSAYLTFYAIMLVVLFIPTHICSTIVWTYKKLRGERVI